MKTNRLLLIFLFSTVICIVFTGLIFHWSEQFRGLRSDPTDSAHTPPDSGHGSSVVSELVKSFQSSDERQKEKILKEFRSGLQDLELRRIADQSKAAVETPIGPVLREKLNIPASQLTRAIDIRYLTLTPPSEAEKEEIKGRISSLVAESGQAGPELERKLQHISSQFLNYSKKYKLAVLTKARGSSGKYNLTAYNTDEILEFDDGGGPQLLPDNIESSFECYDLPYESIVRYGYLFSVRE